MRRLNETFKADGRCHGNKDNYVSVFSVCSHKGNEKPVPWYSFAFSCTIYIFNAKDMMQLGVINVPHYNLCYSYKKGWLH